jgi:hypothetical protein
MRNWLKGMFGASPSLPPAITTSWVDELRQMLAESHVTAGTELGGAHLESAIEFILHGEGEHWVPPPPVVTGRPGISHRFNRKPPRQSFYAGLADIPGAVLLRWALVLEGFASPTGVARFLMPFPGNVHWPEIVLTYGAGGMFNVWPPNTTQAIAYATLEKMLTAAGIEPHALLAGAFATPVESRHGAALLLAAVSYCPDFSEAVGRHLEAIRPLLLAGGVAQRLHVIGSPRNSPNWRSLRPNKYASRSIPVSSPPATPSWRSSSVSRSAASLNSEYPHCGFCISADFARKTPNSSPLRVRKRPPRRRRLHGH